MPNLFKLQNKSIIIIIIKRRKKLTYNKKRLKCII